MKRVLGVFLFIALVASCKRDLPPPGVERACVLECERGVSRCDALQCRRGCGLILDRLREGERQTIFTCMHHKATECTDAQWASCAAQVGPYIDGGPIAPERKAFEDE